MGTCNHRCLKLENKPAFSMHFDSSS
uniref:Uncharacterized protein n=1 Tax=Rhizophora mucronata TaxID=61149 RepID=A0A2P2NZ54_RHIMU